MALSCCIFLGLQKQKGLDILLEAWTLMDDTRKLGHQLVIAGDGPLRTEVLKTIQSGTTDLHYVGLVEDEEKSWLLRDASALVLPSRFEGLPAVLLEAAWEGLPVAMSDVNGLGKFTAMGALDSPCSRTMSSRALMLYPNLPVRTNQRGNLGLTLVEALARDYLWPNVANEILGVYENAIKQKFHSGVR